MVGMSESLDKLLVTQELQHNKTKQINPWNIGIREQAITVCLWSERKGLSCLVCFLQPTGMSSSILSRICIRKKVLF